MPRQKQSNPKPLKLQREEIKQLIKDGSSSHQPNTDESFEIPAPKKKHHHHHHHHKHSKKKKTKYKSAMKVKIADKVRNKRLAKALRDKQVGKKKKKKKEMEMDDLSGISNDNNNQHKGIAGIHVNQEVSNLIDTLSPDLENMSKDKYDLIKERSSRLQQKKKDKGKDSNGSPVKKVPEKIARRTVSEPVPNKQHLSPIKLTLSLKDVKDVKEVKHVRATSESVSDKSVISSEDKSVEEEDSVSKQHALEALLQITGDELNTMTKSQAPTPVQPVTTLSQAPVVAPVVTTSSHHQSHGGNIVKITETDTGMVKYQLRNESLEEQGLALVYTAQTTGQADSSVLYGAYKPRKSGKSPTDVDKEAKSKKPGRHVCQFCGRRCTKPSVLKKHIRSHTGERPYPCVPCGFWFKTKSNLYKHCKSHAHAIKAGLTPNSEDMGKVDFDEDNDSEETESEDEGQACIPGMTPTSPCPVSSPASITMSGSGDHNIPQSESGQINASHVGEDGDVKVQPKLERSELRQRLLERRISLNALNESAAKEIQHVQHPVVTNIPAQQQRQSVSSMKIKEEVQSPAVVQAAFALPADITKSSEDVVMSAAGSGDILKSLLPAEVAGFRIDMETKRAVPVLSNQLSTTHSGPVLSSPSTINQAQPSPHGTPGQLMIPVTGFNIVKSRGQFHVQIPVQGVPDENIHKDLAKPGAMTVQNIPTDMAQAAKPMCKESVQERIQQLITQNEAIVDTATLDSVKPRRSGMYRRDSTSTPPRLENATGEQTPAESPPVPSNGRDMPTLVKEGTNNIPAAILQQQQGAAMSGELSRKVEILKSDGDNRMLPVSQTPLEGNFLERVLKAPRTGQMPDLAPITAGYHVTGFPGPTLVDRPPRVVTPNELAVRVASTSPFPYHTGQPHGRRSSDSGGHSSGSSNTIKNLLQDKKYRDSVQQQQLLLQQQQLNSLQQHQVTGRDSSEKEAQQHAHMLHLQAALQSKMPMSPSSQMQVPGLSTTVFVPGGPPGGIYPPQAYRGYPTQEELNAENQIRRRKYKSESEALPTSISPPPKRRGRKPSNREMPELALIGNNDSNADIPEENTSGHLPPLGSPHAQLAGHNILPFAVQGLPIQQQLHLQQLHHQQLQQQQLQQKHHHQPVGLLQTVTQASHNTSYKKPPASEVSVIQHTSIAPPSKSSPAPLRIDPHQYPPRQTTPLLPWHPGLATQYLGHQVLPGPASLLQQYSPQPNRLSSPSPHHKSASPNMPLQSPHQPKPASMEIHRTSPHLSKSASSNIPPVSSFLSKSASPNIPPVSSFLSKSASLDASPSSLHQPISSASPHSSECIPTAMQILAAVANNPFNTQSTASLPTHTLTVPSTSSTGPVLSTGSNYSFPPAENRPSSIPHVPIPGPPTSNLPVPSVHVRRPSFHDHMPARTPSQPSPLLNSPLQRSPKMKFGEDNQTLYRRSPQQKRIFESGPLQIDETPRSEEGVLNRAGASPKRPKLDMPATSVFQPGKKPLLKRPGSLGPMSRGHLTLDIPSPLTGPVTNSPKEVKPQLKIDPKSLLTPEALSIASSVMRLASPMKPNTPTTPVDHARELGRLMAHAFHNAGGKVESLLTTTKGQVVLGPIATPTPTGSKQIFLLPSPSTPQAPSQIGSSARSPRSPRTPLAPFPSKDTLSLFSPTKEGSRTPLAPFPSKDTPKTASAPFPSKDTPKSHLAPFSSRDTPNTQTAPFPSRDTLKPQSAPFISKDASKLQSASFSFEEAPKPQSAQFSPRDSSKPQFSPFPSRDTLKPQSAPFISKDASKLQSASFSFEDAPKPQSVQFSPRDASKPQSALFPSRDSSKPPFSPFPSKDALKPQSAPFISKDTSKLQSASFSFEDAPKPQSAQFPSRDTLKLQSAPFPSRDSSKLQFSPFPSRDALKPQSAPYLSKDTPKLKSASFSFEDALKLQPALFQSKDTLNPQEALFQQRDTLTLQSATFPSRNAPNPQSAPFHSKDTPTLQSASFSFEDVSKPQSAPFPSRETLKPKLVPFPPEDTMKLQLSPFPSRDTPKQQLAQFPPEETLKPQSSPFPLQDILKPQAGLFPSRPAPKSQSAPFLSKDETKLAPFSPEEAQNSSMTSLPLKDMQRIPVSQFPSEDIKPFEIQQRPRSTQPMARITPQRLQNVFSSLLSEDHLCGLIKTNTPMRVSRAPLQPLQFASSSTRNQLLTQGTYCCLRRSQPMYVQQGSNMKISMYSNWKAGGNSQHPLGMSWKAHMGLYNSSRNKKARLFYILSNISQPKSGIVTQSGSWKPEQMTLKVENQQPLNTSLLQNHEDSASMSDTSATSQLDLKIKEKKSKDHQFHKQDGHRIPIFKGGFKSNEDYEYVRGRGRGKYVCEECGIRCKKPSMLKKHIRTHTDMRPYQCSICNFAFKTKGNLTKHMKSKAHNKKCLENGITPGEGDLDQSYEDGDYPGHQFSDADEEDTDSADGDSSDDESELGTPISLSSGRDPATMFPLSRERRSSVPNLSELDRDGKCIISQPASAGPLKRSFSEIFERPRRNSMPAGSVAFGSEQDRDRLDSLIGELQDHEEDDDEMMGDGRDDDRPMKLSRSEVVGKLSRHLTNRHQAQRAAAAAGKDQSSTTFDMSQLPQLHPGLLFPSTQPMNVQYATLHGVNDKANKSIGMTPQGPPVLDKLGHILAPTVAMTNQYRLATTIHSTVTSSTVTESVEEKSPQASTMSSLPASSSPTPVGAYVGTLVDPTNSANSTFPHDSKPNVPNTPTTPLTIQTSPAGNEPHRAAVANFGVLGFPSSSAIASSVVTVGSIAGSIPRPKHLPINPINHFDRYGVMHQGHLTPQPHSYERQESREGNSFTASLAHNAYMQARMTMPAPFSAQPLLTPLHLPPGTFHRDGSPRKVPPPLVEPISDDEDEHSAKKRRLMHPDKHMKSPRPWDHQSGNAIKQLLLQRPQMWPGGPETPQSPFSSPFLPPSPSVTSAKTIPGPVAASFSSHHGRPPLVSPILPSNLSQLPPTILSQVRSPTQLKSPAHLPSMNSPRPNSPRTNSPRATPPSDTARVRTPDQHSQFSPKGKPHSPAVAESHEEEVNLSPTSGGNHKCPTCSRVFMKPNQLRIHMRTHPDEQTFKCHECDLEFANRNLLAKHERSEQHLSKVEAVELPAAGDTDPRPFKCKLCQIAFRIRGHLAKHLRSRGHILALEREGSHSNVRQDHLMLDCMSDDPDIEDGDPHSPASSDKTDSASECGDMDTMDAQMSSMTSVVQS